MNEIPPLAWFAIGVIIIIFIGVNVSMIGLLRNGPPKHRSDQTLQRLHRVTGKMRKPFEEESQQLKELSGLVQGLKEKSPPEKPDQPS